MSMARYFFLSLNILNGLLGLALAGVVHYAVIPRLDPAVRVTLPAVAQAIAPQEKQKAPPQLPVADYAVISEKNLFHPERKPPLDKQPEKILPKPDVFLYGTLIAGEESIAFIEDKKSPYSTPGRGKRQIALKKGDTLSGYTLGEIAENRIVFVKGTERVVVMLDDREKKRTSEASSAPAAAGPSTAGIAPPMPVAPSAPQAASLPLSAPPVASRPAVPAAPPRPAPRPSTIPSPPLAPPPAAALEAPQPRPGIGASGAWPPTKSTIEQTQQRIQEGRQLREQQIHPAP